MNHKSSSRKSVGHEQQTRTKERNSESNRVERQRTACSRKVNEEIQGKCCADNEPREIEIQEPRYDPKELRDAVRILSPFVRLMEDANNPYARIVAREVCKTFYRLFHQDKHPKEVMKTINWKSKIQRTKQLWNEYRFYVHGGKIKKWVSLRECDFIDFNDLNQELINNEDCGPIDCSPINPCPNAVNNCRKPLQYSTPKNAQCITPKNVNPCLHNNIPPGSCEHQSAGHDPIPFAHEPKSILRKNISPTVVQISAEEKNKYSSEMQTQQICEKISNSKRQLEELVKAAGKKCSGMSMNNIEESDSNISNRSTEYEMLNRQTAGNDTILPHSEPGCSTDPPRDYRDNLLQNEYYRKIADSPRTPRQKQNNCKSLVEPEPRINTQDNNECREECAEDSDTAESAKNILNMNQIACDATRVADAFANLSMAENDLRIKKEAFRKLTENYLKFSSNPLEVSPPACSNSPNTRMMMQEIYKNAQKLKINFDDDDDEMNDNCFKDRDFIRILPFYEMVHNELEYISKTQREYGVNMLDDIMSTCYHIHYDLGDPRLKSYMVLEHVKLITRNTWELYFYKGKKKIPAIPEPPQFRSIPKELPFQCNTRASNCEQPVKKTQISRPNMNSPKVHNKKHGTSICCSRQDEISQDYRISRRK